MHEQNCYMSVHAHTVHTRVASSGFSAELTPTEERVKPREWRQLGDELVGLETLQEESPAPKLTRQAGVWGVSREALHTRNCRLAVPSIGAEDRGC